MLKIPNPVFDKKNLLSSWTETKKGEKKNNPVYSVQYLAKKKKKKQPQGYLAQYLQQNL